MPIYRVMRACPGRGALAVFLAAAVGLAVAGRAPAGEADGGAGTSPAAAPAGAKGGFWPQFHGPNRDNLSAETGLLARWPEGGPPLAWTFGEAGRGYAGVSVAGGRIFTSGDFGADEYVLALDLAGRPLWKTANGPAWRGSTPGARGTPTYVDGALYHMGPTGRLAAFDADTGRQRWAVDTAQAFGARPGTWGLAENVLVEGDLVFCAPGGDGGRIVALDRATGRTVWANTTIADGVAYASPIVVTHGGVRQLITLLRRTVVGVDVRTGRLLWTHPHPNRYNQNVDRPVYHAGRVFVASGHKAGARVIEISPSSDAAREIWFSEAFDNCHGGVLLRGGHLYGCGCRLYHKGLMCVDFATGRTVYRVESIGKPSLTWAEDRFYGIDQAGRVMLIRADPDGAEVVSEFRIPMVGKDQSLAHPVVCGGRLYLRQDRNVFAYDIRAKAQ